MIEKSPESSQTTSSSKQEMPDYRDKHSILYCHKCTECKNYYKSIKVLTRHKLDEHKLTPVYRCANTNNCNQEFRNVSEFLDHAKLHPQKNIICTRCKMKFTNKKMLRYHMKNMHYNRKSTQDSIKYQENSSSTDNRRYIPLYS